MNVLGGKKLHVLNVYVGIYHIKNKCTLPLNTDKNYLSRLGANWLERTRIQSESQQAVTNMPVPANSVRLTNADIVEYE